MGLQTPVSATKKDTRLNLFEYFRSVSILFIVTSHCYTYWAIESFYEKVFANLIAGGTILFVFISGFFFHHVFYPKFQYQQFILKKAKYVLLPYTLLTIAGIACFVFYLGRPPYAEIFMATPISDWQQYAWLCLHYWLVGNILDAYWYIPFIMIIFALSPLFIKQIQLPIKAQLGLFIFLVCLSSLAQRPAHNLSPLHSVIYFIPIYMLGIMCSIKIEQVLRFLKDKSLLLGISVIFLSTAQVLIYNQSGSVHKENLMSYQGIDLMIFQKILMCFFLLSALQKLKDKQIPFLSYLASTSFAIYFIHPWILYFFDYFSVLKRFSFLSGITGFTVTVIMVIAVSLTISAMLKRVLANRSRLVIGW